MQNPHKMILMMANWGSIWPWGLRGDALIDDLIIIIVPGGRDTGCTVYHAEQLQLCIAVKATTCRSRSFSCTNISRILFRLKDRPTKSIQINLQLILQTLLLLLHFTFLCSLWTVPACVPTTRLKGQRPTHFEADYLVVVVLFHWNDRELDVCELQSRRYR